MAAAPRIEGVQLDIRQRFWFVTFGVVLLLLAALYQLIPRSVSVVVPQCERAADGCVVAVSATSDSAVTIALVALSSAGFLIAIVRYALTIEAGGLKLAWGATVSNSTEASSAPSLVTSAALTGHGSLTATSTASMPDPVPLERSVQLYQELPLDVAYAADDAWRDVHPDSTLSEVINEVRHKAGRGSYPWFLNLRQPDGVLVWLKISKGGRGKRGSTVTFQDPVG